MGYTSEDLDVFILQWDKNRLEGTAYFELHHGELPEPLACWLPGSAFVRDAAFDFLVTCFERANPEFDYFAFERFDTEQVKRLVRELVDFAGDLTPGCSRDIVFSRYNSLFRREIWDGVETEPLRTAVAKCAKEVAEFVQNSPSENQCLWVLGM
jgi:hypothetical protein